MKQPTHIRAEEIGEKRTVPDTRIFVYRAHSMDKGEVLARILQAEGRGLTMVFCRTTRTCDKVAADMSDRGFAAAAVHGDLGQGAREQALRAFRAGKIDVLVATDVAARGIDVQDVTHVINYQCPDEESTFLHRIGRTGRAGAKGVAVTFVDWDDMPKWGLINKALELPIPEPVETYSSSKHLYSDLGIPEGTKGTLPRSARVRAGLDAEVVEDLGETGRRKPAARDSGRDGGRGRDSGRDAGRGGRSAGGRDDRPAEGGDDAPVLPKRQSSTRRRTRGGGAALEAVAGAPAGADDAGDAPAGEDGAPRRRRRGGRGRGRGADEGAAAPAAE
jgi:superfamily II DNA/RNA helicase